MKTLKNIAIVLFAMLIIISCTDESDDSISKSNLATQPTPLDVELITTVELLILDTAINQTDTVRYRDLDGEGGFAPNIGTIHLKANQMYPVRMRFLDESNPNDIENITTEIIAEADEHFVCFAPQNASAITVSIKDSDGTYPIGLESDWLPISSQQTMIKISLKHQPGVKNGTCDPGETDVEVDFPLNII